MREEKRKEILTRANIRKDLKRNLRKRIGWVVALLSLWIVIVLCLVYLLSQGVWLNSIGVIPLLVGVVLSAVAFGIALLALCRLIVGLRRDLFITTGKLVKADCEESGNNGYHYTWCDLTFSGYDKYTVRTVSGQTLHPWSELYPLSAEGEYYYAFEGDAYYLVLSKPHSGKILMAYNKKLFELVD